MKRVVLIVLIGMMVTLPTLARISIVWDQVYDGIILNQNSDFVALGNGEFLCFFVRPGAGSFVHAVRVTIDGVIVDHHVFDTPLYPPQNVHACENPDGGAYLIQGLNGEYLLSRYDYTGTLIENTLIDRNVMQWCDDIICTPDDKLILGGNDPDLRCLATNGAILWLRDFPLGFGEGEAIHYVVRMHRGLFLAVGVELGYSVFYPFHGVFSEKGVIYREHFSGQEYRNKYNPVLSPTEDNIVYMRKQREYPTTTYVEKDNGWTRALPNFTNTYEYWNDLDPILGESGYLAVGYLEDDDVYTGYIVELAEEAGAMRELTLDDRLFYQSAAAFDGSMLVAGQQYNHTTHVWELTLTRVEPTETHLPVQAKLWVYRTPVWLYADGGTIYYRTLIENDLDYPTPVTFRLKLVVPDAPDLLVEEWTQLINPNHPIVAIRQQLEVDASLPSGAYRIVLEAFDQSGNLLSHSHENFYKYPGSGVDSETDAEIATPDYSLASVFPNPFNAATTINVTLPETTPLTVRVFDIQGRTVATLADGGSVAAGSHAFSFDGSNLSSGIYFVQATVPGKMNEVRKLMLVK